jgi:hypothetical protein
VEYEKNIGGDLIDGRRGALADGLRKKSGAFQRRVGYGDADANGAYRHGDCLPFIILKEWPWTPRATFMSRMTTTI